MVIDRALLWEIRQDVKLKKPLVWNITNNVVTNFTANVLLAAGAAPLMSEGFQEAGDLAKIADVLVLNTGTPHPRQAEYFLAAGRIANEKGKPVVLDPVGAGATSYRNEVAAGIINEIKLSLVRGNYGEISFLAGTAGRTRGVDSTGNGIDPGLISGLAAATGALIAATGESDYLSDGKSLYINNTGHVLLQSVTGTGCALTSLAGAFIAAAGDPCLGVLAALAFYGAAAERAAAVSSGPGSFAVNFIDALCGLDGEDFERITDGRVHKTRLSLLVNLETSFI
ncbi:MAG: hydroxyethylthiazole kinase [Firmicutes bacterium]|nr:hydroxyethylthiazole kinase [Bacillota bacterium]